MAKKKDVKTAIGFTNADKLQKHIKWFKRGVVLLDIGFLITIFSTKKILYCQTLYEGADQHSIDNINNCEQNIINTNK